MQASPPEPRGAEGRDKEARKLQAERGTLQVEVRARGLEVSRLAQEAISADEIAGNLRLQRAHDQRELQREGEHGERREALLGELRAALATESGRVAKAWEQRERMRAAVAERDAQLRQLQTEAFHLTPTLTLTNPGPNPNPN